MQYNDFINCETFWVNSQIQMFRLIRKCGVVIFGNARGLEAYVDYARKKDKVIIQNMDICSFDFINYLPDLYCAISEKFKDVFVNKFNYPLL